MESRPADDYNSRRRQRYASNLEEERTKARNRATRRHAELSDDELQRRREQHRKAQARYRELNRIKCLNDCWQYRRDKKAQKAKEKDEREYMEYMLLEA